MKQIALLLLISSTAIAQKKVDFNEFYPIDRGHSSIEFSIKYMGYAKVKGRFADFSGMIRYDEKNLKATSVSVVIKTESIDTDLDFRDNDLKSDNWFDAKTYPLITFTSKSIKETPTGFDLTGDLTIKGVTREVVLKMDKPSGVLKDIRQDHQIIFTGTTAIKRTEYGVEGKNWSAVKEGITAVSDEVTIELSILGKKVKAPNYANRVRNEEAPPGKIYKAFKDQGTQQAIEIFRTLKSAGNVDRGALSTVGYMLVLEGNVKDALTFFETNRESFPDAPEVYYDLGEACGISGDLSKSKVYFQESLAKNPGYAWAMEILRHL